MNDLTFAGPPGVIVLVAYGAAMLGIGWWVSRTRVGVRDSMQSYYLAGRHLGIIVLFFTLYATQYSGNNIVGYAPSAYRLGFEWWQSVMFMTVIIGGYLLFAPRLQRIARRERFLTPTDWLRHRFDYAPISVLAALLMLWGLGNFMLEQLVAMGHGIAGLTGGTVPYQVAMLGFVFVMVAYSWMGGMRAVAFTDVMQGVALLVGVAVLVIGGLVLIGGDLGDAFTHVVTEEPDKAAVPSLEGSVSWLSMLVLVGIGAAVYPHAIQRIYAAESTRTLRRSFAWIAWMPLVTTAVIFVVGIIGIQLYPGLSDGESEELVGRIANDVAALGPFYYVMMILLFGGIIAAIVSTADSVLLSFSSIVSSDLYQRHINPGASEKRALLVGKVAGLLAVAGLLVLAWNPPTLLVNIFVLKFELLIQIAPAFIIGLYWKRMARIPVFVGMLAGAVLSGGMALAGAGTLFGIHAGVVGLALNTLIAVVGSALFGPDKPHPTTDANREKSL
ncbi:sodium:solute symporter family protein [Spiractinospora alimapuensis]|uniref:sodium:solute symporter family protein n=1 Tax=Spiractinospora alimapuensis TaxID=2820884 RepID=UPI001F1FC9DA|nr:sodium:solute symporter family protein [Spiractinospora alimapuensis]QVQ53988.1 sodium:solute symporter family protein [Spiractinospora alimapuensis]